MQLPATIQPLRHTMAKGIVIWADQIAVQFHSGVSPIFDQFHDIAKPAFRFWPWGPLGIARPPPRQELASRGSGDHGEERKKIDIAPLSMKLPVNHGMDHQAEDQAAKHEPAA
jgi:hypothetical protein